MKNKFEGAIIRVKYSELDTICAEYGCELHKNEAMKKHTSFKIGGKADRFIYVQDKRSLSAVLKVIKENDYDFFILGNGSNLLVSDKGYRGVVLNLVGEFKKIEIEHDRVLKCGAGASLAAVCAFARNHSLSGLEFAWGIPGLIGGAAYMNAGAYGGEMKQVVHSCSHMDPDGNEGSFVGDELDFSYRHSVYADSNKIITGVSFLLEISSEAEIGAKMDELMERRTSKQPLEYPSAGSVFKRPEGYFAAALIEECGLKGRRVGGAVVSEKHSGFIVNDKGADCSDVLALIEIVKQGVLRQKGVRLECEIKIVGEF